MLKSIPFTQYLLPDGRQQEVSVTRPVDVLEKAEAIIQAGFRFECEMLSDGTTCSFTISDDDQDWDVWVCPDGPKVLATIDQMIRGFDIAKTLAKKGIKLN